MTPGLGERVVPVRVRLAAAVALTIVAAPLISPGIGEALFSTIDLMRTIVSEAIVGFMFGFAMRIAIFAMQTAGAIIAQHVSISQLFGPTIGFDAEGPYTSIIVLAAITIAVTVDLHFYMVNALVQSYNFISLGQFPSSALVADWSVRTTGEALHIALALAAPFIVLGFIYSIALAAASRAMPQLMAAFVGAPAITIAGMALFSVAAPVLLSQWLSFFMRSFSNSFGFGG